MTQQSGRLRLVAGAGAAALMLAGAGMARAAEPVTELEAITITAQKRAQDTLDVGLNVAVISGADLAARRVTQVSDLSAVSYTHLTLPTKRIV